MINEEQLKARLANNIARFRKKNNMTQQQLAEKINYSDKSVSKWERKEGLPDLIVLIQIADIFGVSIDDLINVEGKDLKPKRKMSHLLIILISYTSVWVLSTIIYTLLSLIKVDLFPLWLLFIYAIPASSIILVVFTQLWGTLLQQFISISLLLWSLILSIFLSFSIIKLWLLFVSGGSIQILFLFWFALRKTKSKNVLR